MPFPCDFAGAVAAKRLGEDELIRILFPNFGVRYLEEPLHGSYWLLQKLIQQEAIPVTIAFLYGSYEQPLLG
jgi:hypothetical protein